MVRFQSFSQKRKNAGETLTTQVVSSVEGSASLPSDEGVDGSETDRSWKGVRVWEHENENVIEKENENEWKRL